MFKTENNFISGKEMNPFFVDSIVTLSSLRSRDEK